MNSKIMTLALLAGTSVALAAPRENADLVALNGGAIGSKDLPGSANNTVLTVHFNGSDGGGSYNARFLNVSGTIGATFSASYFREAVVKITPPDGTPFYAQIINSGATGTGAPISGSVAVVPVSGFTTAGDWTFEFVDYFNDVTAGDFIDASWTAFNVSLDDGPVPAPAVGAGPSVTATNLMADGVLGDANNGVVTWNNGTPTALNGLRLSGLVTMGDANPAANLNANATPDVRIEVTRPNGTTVTVTPILTNGLSSQAFDVTLPLTGNGTGDWSFRFFDAANIANVIDNYVPSFTASFATVVLPTPAGPVTDLGVVGNNVVATATFTTTAPTEVKWAKFSTLADVLASNEFYVDIDTQDTVMTGTGTAVNDTEIALYDIFGTKLVEDDDDGSGPLSALSLGNAANPRPALGDGPTYNGRDGAVLAASTYYVAAGSYNKAFANAFLVTHTAAGQTTNAAGTLVVNVRSNLPVPPSQCSVADIGVAGGLPGQDRQLNNNDFIAFIAYFFAQNPIADMGIAGGLPGSDGQWNNNDFIAFIAHFFADGAACNG